MSDDNESPSLIDSRVLIVSEEAPGFLRAVIANPPRSLIDNAVFAGFRLLRQYAETHGTRVIVFESADPNFFVAHLDIKNVNTVPDLPGAQSIFTGWPEFSHWLSTGPVVTIAKIRGITRGIGNEFVCACDMRFASLQKARFAQLEMGYALIPGGGGIEWLPQHVGRSRALEIVLSADDFDATTAELYGWINRALPDADLDEYVDVFARRLASFDSVALTTGKNFVNSRCTIPTVDELTESFKKIVELLAREESKRRYAVVGAKGAATRTSELITPRLFV